MVKIFFKILFFQGKKLMQWFEPFLKLSFSFMNEMDENKFPK